MVLMFTRPKTEEKKTTRQITLPYVKKEGKFRKVLEEFKREGLELLTAKDYAELVINEKTGTKFLEETEGCTVILSEGCVVLPKGDALITIPKYNPIMKYDKNIPHQILNQLKSRAEKDPKKALKSGVLYFPDELSGWYKLGFAKKDRSFIENPLAIFLFEKYSNPLSEALLKKEFAGDSINVDPGDNSELANERAPYATGLGMYSYEIFHYVVSADPDNEDRIPCNGPLESVFYGIPKKKE